MKITFLGLSSFLIENKYGHRILIDPYNDSPRWSFGLNFPKNVGGKRLSAELVLMSHMDADHASFRPELSIELPQKKKYKKKEIKINFPNLALRGTLVSEWNGYPNIAWSFNIDGKRILYLADNVPVLTKSKLEEAGKIDILFISPAKVKGDFNNTFLNIRKIQPKFVVWSHHIPTHPFDETDEKRIRTHLSKTILAQKKNPHANKYTVQMFTDILSNIFEMNKKFKKVKLLDKPTFVLPSTPVGTGPTVLFFRVAEGN